MVHLVSLGIFLWFWARPVAICQEPVLSIVPETEAVLMHLGHCACLGPSLSLVLLRCRYKSNWPCLQRALVPRINFKHWDASRHAYLCSLRIQWSYLFAVAFSAIGKTCCWCKLRFLRAQLCKGLYPQSILVAFLHHQWLCTHLWASSSVSLPGVCIFSQPNLCQRASSSSCWSTASWECVLHWTQALPTPWVVLPSIYRSTLSLVMDSHLPRSHAYKKTLRELSHS